MSTMIKEFPIDDIVIMKEFEDAPPSAEKMIRKEQYLMATDKLPGRIVLNENNILIDGYATYLLAKKYGYTIVPIEVGCIEVVEARFKPKGKLYMWKVPRQLQGRVRVGDVAVVQANYSKHEVIVECVDQLQYWERPLKEILHITCR